MTLIGGEPAELVDAHWLFATISAPPRVPASSRSAACRATTRGCRTCCARSSRPPAIASIGDDDEVEADLVIVSEGAEVDKKRGGADDPPALRPDAAGDKDESIYRYDRAGLLMALKSAGAGRGR